MTLEDIQRELTKIVCDRLGFSPDQVGPDVNLRTLPGVESIKVLRVVVDLENKFGVELEDQVVFNVNTVGELSAVIAELLAEKQGKTAAGTGP